MFVFYMICCGITRIDFFTAITTSKLLNLYISILNLDDGTKHESLVFIYDLRGISSIGFYCYFFCDNLVDHEFKLLDTVVMKRKASD
jgi:hypothetical protein